MTKYMISWDDDTVFIEAPRSPEIMELVKKIFGIGVNPVGGEEVKPKKGLREAKPRKRLQEKELINHIHTILSPKLFPNVKLTLDHEDDLVANFHTVFPSLDINDHRLRRHIRQIIKKGGESP